MKIKQYIDQKINEEINKRLDEKSNINESFSYYAPMYVDIKDTKIHNIDDILKELSLFKENLLNWRDNFKIKKIVKIKDEIIPTE